MKSRFIADFLAVAVLCCCMTVAVSASEVEAVQQQFLNVLEYATPNESGNYYITADSSGVATAKFTMPFGSIIRYVDMYISSSRAVNTASLVVGSTTTALTVEAVYGTTYYRIYGQFGGSYTETFTLKFNTGVAGHYMQFYSLHMSPQVYSVFGSPSTFIVEDQSATQTSGSSLVSLNATLSSSMTGPFLNWTSSVRNNNWQKYDMMTFTLSYYTATINNINVQIGGIPVPFESNWIENPPSFDAYIGSGGAGQTANIYSVSVTVDLTGVNRTLTDDLIVTVQGMGTFVNASLHRSSGHNPAELPDAEITWLQRIALGLDTMRNYVFGIRERFDTLLDKIVGDTAAADDFQNQVTDKTDELDSIGDAIGSVQKPDDYDPNVSGMENMGELMSGGGLAYVIGSPYILPLITASMGLCFASYALFGKKG